MDAKNAHRRNAAINRVDSPCRGGLKSVRRSPQNLGRRIPRRENENHFRCSVGGSQFTSEAFTSVLRKAHVEVHMGGHDRPHKNFLFGERCLHDRSSAL